MQLHLSSWPEVQNYLETSKAILIPIGSTEQHGAKPLTCFLPAEADVEKECAAWKKAMEKLG